MPPPGFRANSFKACRKNGFRLQLSRCATFKNFLSGFLFPSVTSRERSSCGMVPHRIIQRKTDEPAKKKTKVEVFHERPFASNGAHQSEQQGFQKPFRSNPGAPDGRGHLSKFRVKGSPMPFHGLLQGPQGMLLLHSGFQGHVREHFSLPMSTLSHRLISPFHERFP